MSVLAIWKFKFHEIGDSGSPPGDLLYSNVAGITNHTKKILNFDGVNVHCDLTSKAIPTATSTFEIEDVDHALDVTDFEDEFVTISVEDEGSLDRKWKLKVTSAVYSYGTIKIKCESELGSFENSRFPPYPSIKSVAPQIDQIPENLCVPYTIGRAYIPIYPILYQGNRRYLLGKEDDVTGDFTITKVRSPRDYPTLDYWDDSYTYNQETINSHGVSYEMTDMIIARSDPTGDVDSNGIFQVSGKLFSPLVQYEGDEESKHPGASVYDVLLKAGAENCDSTSFTDVDTSYFSDVYWACGFWEYQDTETLVSDMLSQCDCYLTIDDEIHLNLFDSASVETFEKSMLIKDSYTISDIKKPEFDGGIVRWAWDGEPEDVLTAEYAVHLESVASSAGLPETVDTDAFEYKYGFDDAGAITPQKFGILHFQKKHGKVAQISFQSKLDQISEQNDINPGQVIDIDDDTNSGSSPPEAYDIMDILIYEMHFHSDLTVDINGYAYDDLEDWVQVSAFAVYPEGEIGADVIIDGEENTGNEDTNSCMQDELEDAYNMDVETSGVYTTKTEAGQNAFNLWTSLGDDAKWEPWNGVAVTTNHTWTGDTGDFAITSEELTATLTAGESSTISLAGLEIHAQDIRLNSTITITGTSADTYCRLKLTDDDSTVRYLYLAVGDSSWVDTADKFLIGDGEVTDDLADYGLVEIITDISIECAVHAGDTSIQIAIDFIDFEYRHDMFDLCAECDQVNPELETGAHVVLSRSGPAAYAFYYDECESGDATKIQCCYNSSAFIDDETDESEEYVGCITIEPNYEAMPWQIVYVDSSNGIVNVLLPQETDHFLRINDRVMVVDYAKSASSNTISISTTDTNIEGQDWTFIDLVTDGLMIECIWTGTGTGWFQLKQERLVVSNKCS